MLDLRGKQLEHGQRSSVRLPDGLVHGVVEHGANLEKTRMRVGDDLPVGACCPALLMGRHGAGWRDRAEDRRGGVRLAGSPTNQWRFGATEAAQTPACRTRSPCDLAKPTNRCRTARWHCRSSAGAGQRSPRPGRQSGDSILRSSPVGSRRSCRSDASEEEEEWPCCDPNEMTGRGASSSFATGCRTRARAGAPARGGRPAPLSPARRNWSAAPACRRRRWRRSRPWPRP